VVPSCISSQSHDTKDIWNLLAITTLKPERASNQSKRLVFSKL